MKSRGTSEFENLTSGKPSIFVGYWRSGVKTIRPVPDMTIGVPPGHWHRFLVTGRIGIHICAARGVGEVPAAESRNWLS